jgi:hypothetical protein
MTLHILNGDSLAFSFNLPDHKVVCREAFAIGKVELDFGTPVFWQTRQQTLAEALAGTHEVINAETYQQKVVSEFEKLQNLQDYSEITLWFDADLFCQINQLALLGWLAQQNLETIRLSTASPETAIGNDFQSVWADRAFFTAQDLQFARQTWQYYAAANPLDLQDWLKQAFPPILCHLKNALQLHLQRFPTVRNELSILENQILAFIDQGLQKEQDIVEAMLCHTRAWGFGDVQYSAMLGRLLPLLNEVFFTNQAEVVLLNDIAAEVRSGKQFLRLQPHIE